ncbi:MAG: beta-lactamase family protein [Myxococcales bacterium]|nr:beta-lactamase family protein [Myxococcales bacterium]
MHDEQPTDLERRALAAWTPTEPPPDFADRVMTAATHTTPSTTDLPELPRIGLRWPRVAAAVLAATALVGTAAAALKYSVWSSGQVKDPAPAGRNSLDHFDPRDPGDAVDTSRRPAPAGPAPLALPGDLSARLDAHVRGYGAKYGPAFAFRGSLVVARRGEVLYAGHFGHTSDGGPAIDDNTRFKIGSLTQQFIAVAVLQLRDEGKLDLDDPVARHLSEFTDKRVTVRHLLSHTSGVRSYTDSLPLLELEPHKTYPQGRILESFKDEPLEFPPGTDFDLSNSGYYLLGMLVERVGKHKLADELQRRIFRPAGMTHTSLGDERRPDPAAPMTTGHEFSEEEVLVPVPGYDLASVYGGAAGIVSTPADLVRWDAALASPGALLSQASFDEMTTPVREDYGLGWIVDHTRGQKFIGHPGGVEGFNSAIARYLGDGITVFAVANTETVDCRDIVEQATEIVYGGNPPPHLEHDEVPVSPAMFERYVGDYTLSEASQQRLSRLVDRDALGVMNEVKIYDDGGRLFMLIPMHGGKWLHKSGEDRFFFKDPSGTTAEFGPPGAPVETLTLRQHGLEFVLKRGKPGGEAPAIRVNSGAFRPADHD